MIKTEPAAFNTGLLDADFTGKSMRLEYRAFECMISLVPLIFLFDLIANLQSIGTYMTGTQIDFKGCILGTLNFFELYLLILKYLQFFFTILEGR